MNRALFCLPALVLATATLPATAAQPLFHTTNVSTCQVISGKPLRTGSRVEFKSGKIGTIVLSCPLEMSLFELMFQPHLWLTYKDSTGTGTKASVKARLVATDKNTGARSSTLVFDSDLLPPKTINRAPGPAGLVLDGFYTKAYTIEITLKRSATGQDVEVYAIEYAPLSG